MQKLDNMFFGDFSYFMKDSVWYWKYFVKGLIFKTLFVKDPVLRWKILWRVQDPVKLVCSQNRKNTVSIESGLSNRYLFLLKFQNLNDVKQSINEVVWKNKNFHSFYCLKSPVYCGKYRNLLWYWLKITLFSCNVSIWQYLIRIHAYQLIPCYIFVVIHFAMHELGAVILNWYFLAFLWLIRRWNCTLYLRLCEVIKMFRT